MHVGQAIAEIRDEAFCQGRVAGGRRRGQVGVDVDVAALGVGLPVEDSLGGDVGEVEGLPALDFALAAGQGQ
jgi:hypothetical protein